MPIRRSCGTRKFLSVAVVITLLGLLAVQIDTVADSAGNTDVQVAAASGEPNDLRWDLAKAFKFDWISAELSAKTVRGADANTPVRTVIVSVNPAILDFTGLVIVDVNGPGVSKVLDQDGNSVEFQLVQSGQIRWYEDQNWDWYQGRARLLTPLKPFNVTFRLSSAPEQAPSSSISQLEGYIYAVYADKVISVDIPLDPNYGWHEAQGISDLLLEVDPETPPCPGPLQYVKINPTGGRLGPSRPTTPIPIYKYLTWVKSSAGTPMLGLRDPWGWRKFCPLGDFAIVRTELFDSKNGRATHFFTQWIMGDGIGSTGAQCFGQIEQGPNDTYDSIRHIIAVHPVEVKIPFMLRDIAIPKLRSAAK